MNILNYVLLHSEVSGGFIILFKVLNRYAQPFSVIIGVEKRSTDDLIARPVFPDLTQVEQKEDRQEESLSANLPHPAHSRNCPELGLFSILVDWEKIHGF
jgi:hypothetical protein